MYPLPSFSDILYLLPLQWILYHSAIEDARHKKPPLRATLIEYFELSKKIIQRNITPLYPMSVIFYEFFSINDKLYGPWPGPVFSGANSCMCEAETTEIFKWVESHPPATPCNVSHSIPKAVGSMEKFQHFEITFMQQDCYERFT